MSHEAVIVAQKLTKRFGPVESVRGIDFVVSKGSCVGLLGPNGAGKTTCMRMIMGLTGPSDGLLTVFGEDADNLDRYYRGRIGLVPQDDNLDPDLSVQQNLHIYGSYFAISRSILDERVPALLAFMQLNEKRTARVSELSGGMKRRLVIARALIADPELIILDEPTTGLDPQARILIWKQLLILKSQGKTLLLTTHYMDEAQRLCDEIFLIDQGRLLDQGAPETLIKRHVLGTVFELRKPLPANINLDGRTIEDIGDAVLVYVAGMNELADHLGPDTNYRHRPANLEDVFLRLTGRALREL